MLGKAWHARNDSESPMDSFWQKDVVSGLPTHGHEESVFNRVAHIQHDVASKLERINHTLLTDRPASRQTITVVPYGLHGPEPKTKLEHPVARLTVSTVVYPPIANLR